MGVTKMPKFRFEDIAINITQKKKPTSDDMKTYVGLEHLDSGSLSVTRWGSNVPIKGEKLIMQKGDILFGKRNAYLRRASIAPHDGLFSAHGMVLRPNERVVSRKLFPFFICSDYFFDAAIRISVGSLSPTINWSALKKLEFILPDMDEQEKLADLLWAANNAKDAYKRLLYLTDELVKSQFIEMFGNPITNDKGWPIELLKKVAPITAPDINKEEFVWWLNLDMIESNSGYLIEKVIVPRSDVGNSTSTFDNTMVLYSKLRPYLNKVFIPDDEGYATTELVGMKPDVKKLNKVFLAFLFRSDHFVHYANSLSGGAQMPRMPMKALREFKCILPPLELQNSFVELTKQADKAKSDLKQNVSNLESTIKVLISKNFGGQV